MKEEIKRILFGILFIGNIFLIGLGILVFFIAPQERLGTSLGILFCLSTGVLIFSRLYKKEEEKKGYLRIIVAIGGIIFALMAIYYLNRGSLTALDKLVYPFIIFIFGAGSILILINRMALEGTIIDNLCASSQKPENLPEFIKTHSKACAIKPACASSGYSIYAYGKFYKFDKASNEKIEAFLKKDGSKLEVSVIVKETNDGLRLITIKNRQNMLPM